MPTIPLTDDILVIRTDYAHQSAWSALQKILKSLTHIDGTPAEVTLVDDPEFADMSIEAIMDLAIADYYNLFVVDAKTLTHPEYPVIALDLEEEPGQFFRLVPAAIVGVEVNLEIANMDFSEFMEAVDDGEIFRGF